MKSQAKGLHDRKRKSSRKQLSQSGKISRREKAVKIQDDREESRGREKRKLSSSRPQTRSQSRRRKQIIQMQKDDVVLKRRGVKGKKDKYRRRSALPLSYVSSGDGKKLSRSKSKSGIVVLADVTHRGTMSGGEVKDSSDLNIDAEKFGIEKDDIVFVSGMSTVNPRLLRKHKRDLASGV